jgi:predicted unusual protein kinase regulating ubiquinone biosynthesis (AarF/ABC1/UbiB family)
MEWIGNQTVAARQSLDETLAVVTYGIKHPHPVATSARLGALARSNSFLWLEAGLRGFEQYSRAVPVTRRATRASVLLALAADLVSGYALLDRRSRLSPALVQPQDWEWQHERSALRIRDTAAALGGTLIKASQFASTRPDILPASYIRTLASLQDHVPAQPWSAMSRAIRRELGRRPGDIFQWIDPRPLASASIAQVHRATLYDGQQVAVKIQYPGITPLIARDLIILRTIVAWIGRVAPSVQLRPILDHLEQTLPLELNFEREAQAMAALRSALKHRTDVLIPEVIPELSSRRILTMEYVDGIKITDRNALMEAGITPKAVARLLNDVYAEQLLHLGWLHADPHPGNLLVRSGPNGPQLVLLDHGLTVALAPTLQAALREMVRALHAGDMSRLSEALRQAGMPLERQVDIATLLQIVGVLLDRPQDHEGGVSAVEMGQSLGRGIGFVPPDLILVGRALGLLDGVTKQLDPDTQTLEIVSGYIEPTFHDND